MCGNEEDLLLKYAEVKTCEYKGRHYLVRDNGAVYRLRRIDGRASKWDEIWTFGRKDDRTGYMFIGEARVHRIVCYAYHGEPVGEQKWVDHIDTNRCNNRPDNLRWVTELENILLNPITRAKVEMICGSVESFLENPSLLYGHESESPHFEWMRTVSKEEADISLKRWKEWSEKPIEERKPKGFGPGESIYHKDNSTREPKKNTKIKPQSRMHSLYVGPYKSYSEHMSVVEKMNRIQHEKDYGLKDSLTPGAKQVNLKPLTEFLLCPNCNQERTLQAYMDNLLEGMAFSCSKYRNGDSVFKWELNPNTDIICLITYNESINDQGFGKPWEVWKITFQEGFYIHEYIDKYYDPDGAERELTLAMGRRWRGGEVLDDYC